MSEIQTHELKNSAETTQKILDDSEKTVRWLSVKEKLPELLTPVLIFSPNKCTGISNIRVGWIVGYFKDGSPIWITGPLSLPSHWAPCPFLPDGAVIEDEIECRNERRDTT